MSRKARQQSIIQMRAIRKADMVERLAQYFTDLDVNSKIVNLSPVTLALQLVEEAEKQGRIDKYGNLIVA